MAFTSFRETLKKFGSRTKDALRSNAEPPSLEPIQTPKTQEEKHPPDRPLD
jgi:hypothetical protein